MKYLGHDTNSRNDIRLRKLIQRHGSKGYGVYWAVNEIIAEKVETHKLDCLLEYSIEDLSAELNEKPDTIQPVLDSCVDFGLLTKAGSNYQNLKILKRLDEYTKKRIRVMSVQYPDTIRTVSPEKKERKEKNEIEFKKDSKALDVKGFFKQKRKDRKRLEEKALKDLGFVNPIGSPSPTQLDHIGRAKDRFMNPKKPQ